MALLGALEMVEGAEIKRRTKLYTERERDLKWVISFNHLTLVQKEEELSKKFKIVTILFEIPFQTRPTISVEHKKDDLMQTVCKSH